MTKTVKKTEALYNVIRAPHITEKATLGSQHGQVTFQVAPTATKPDIKAAIEMLFDVTVKKVNVIVQKGKEKRFRGTLGRRSNMKKAMVTLAEGQTIDVSTGISG